MMNEAIHAQSVVTKPSVWFICECIVMWTGMHSTLTALSRSCVHYAWTQDLSNGQYVTASTTRLIKLMA